MGGSQNWLILPLERSDTYTRPLPGCNRRPTPLRGRNSLRGPHIKDGSRLQEKDTTYCIFSLRKLYLLYKLHMHKNKAQGRERLLEQLACLCGLLVGSQTKDARGFGEKKVNSAFEFQNVTSALIRWSAISLCWQSMLPMLQRFLLDRQVAFPYNRSVPKLVLIHCLASTSMRGHAPSWHRWSRSLR
jgi:hypothetical protein